MQSGDQVRIHCPGNDRINGQIGVLGEWNGLWWLVRTLVGSGEYRALPEELEILKNGHPEKSQQARQMGYTGSICDLCGGCRMVRSGTCEKCEDCGITSGCS